MLPKIQLSAWYKKSGAWQGSALIEQDLHDTYRTHSGEKRRGYGTDHSTGHWLFQALNISPHPS